MGTWPGTSIRARQRVRPGEGGRGEHDSVACAGHAGPGTRPVRSRPQPGGRGAGRRHARHGRPHPGAAVRASRAAGDRHRPRSRPRSRRRAGAAGGPDRVELVHAVYDRIAEVLAELGYRRRPGVLFDLGVSSVQLDDADRGFSYAQDAPLDMRMDPTTGITAAEVVNTYPGAELTRILRRVRRGAVRRPDRRRRSSAERARAAVHHQRAAGRTRPGRHPRRQPGAPAATRPSAPSRRCGSRSTTSSARCGAPCPRRSTPSPSAAGSW